MDPLISALSQTSQHFSHAMTCNCKAFVLATRLYHHNELRLRRRESDKIMDKLKQVLAKYKKPKPAVDSAIAATCLLKTRDHLLDCKRRENCRIIDALSKKSAPDVLFGNNLRTTQDKLTGLTCEECRPG